MARDITIRVNGQNPDGTLNVSQVGGDSGNPFGGGGSQNQSMVPYNPSAAGMPAPTGGFRARIGNVDVAFASEADYLKADKALREMRQQEMIPTVGGYGGGGMGGMGGTSGFVRTGANAAEAVGNVAKKIGRAAKAAVNQIATSVEQATAPDTALPAGDGAPAASETISSESGGDGASDSEDDPAPLEPLRVTLAAVPVSAAVLASVSVAAVSAAVPAAASAESEAEDEERRERELAESRRLSAVLDAGDDDLALPREPDGLLEPRDSAGDDD